jgi:hypothetical protein
MQDDANVNRVDEVHNLSGERPLEVHEQTQQDEASAILPRILETCLAAKFDGNILVDLRHNY